VVKSHGGADALGFASAIDLAIDMASSDMIARISADRAGLTESADDSEASSNGAGKAQAEVS
jgi:glycerol-3-phosphate acyltransferase PlsX